jgi:hypothetical protein
MSFYRTNIEKNSSSKVLDIYPSAEGAYSLNKLRTSYTGFCIRAQKADNSTLDVGFIGDNLDTASLLTFAAGADVKVTTWYDQSTNNKNVTQVTYSKMPIIVEAGVLVTYNYKPTMKFVGANSTQLTAPYVNIVNTYSIFSVYSNVTTGAICSVVKSGTSDYCLLYSNGSNMIYRHNGGTAISTTPTLLQNINSVFNVSSVTSFYYNKTLVNSIAATTGSVPTGTLYIGSRNTSNLLTGFVDTVILYNTNESANRTDIELKLEKMYSQDFTFQIKTFFLPDSDGNAPGITGFTNTGLVIDEVATALRSDGKLDVWMCNWGGGSVEQKQTLVNMLIDPAAANLDTAELIVDIKLWQTPATAPGGSIQGIAVANDGTLYVAGLNYTKSGTLIKYLTNSSGGGLAYDKVNDQLIYAISSTNTMMFVNPNTDTIVSSWTYTGTIDHITYDPNEQVIYATGSGIRRFKRDGTVLSNCTVTTSRTIDVEGNAKFRGIYMLLNNDGGYHSPTNTSNLPYSNTNNVSIYRIY